MEIPLNSLYPPRRLTVTGRVLLSTFEHSAIPFVHGELTEICILVGRRDVDDLILH